jgi:hypothetical protein
MSQATIAERPVRQSPFQQILEDLNGRYHKATMWAFAIVVVAHWMEHLVQALQVYVLGWARPDSRGVLGLAFPWLVASEWLHFAYAVLMVLGLIVLRRGMLGEARFWWNVALGIQVWHFVEHFALWGQALTGKFLFGAEVPTSFIQVAMPMFRVELHLAYNLAVTVPMLIAMYHHRHPEAEERAQARCTCAVRAAA